MSSPKKMIFSIFVVNVRKKLLIYPLKKIMYMILSMTGYGKATETFNDKNIIIELRALNSKNLDLKTRMPSNYRELEMPIRKILSQLLKRGKVDLNIQIEDLEDRPKNKINVPVLKQYLADLNQVIPNADQSVLMAAALRLPDVLKPEEDDLSEAEQQAVMKALKEAAGLLTRYRKDEGQALENDLKLRLKNISKALTDIEQLDNERLDKIKQRLKDALNNLQQEVDQNRFEQELIYYLEKLDINEEKVRLKNHLQYFEKELQKPDEMKGKKLGFISQEIGREINTIGSKANDSQIQRKVVQMKDELEKIKEQVLNVL